ncbi:minor capsid protein, partial [Lactiplantibacillus pentosus]|uniref:minor capsid protein n=1 Tax=Lactiplantibacillus pentosus TaxID=1589 RepID=UPI002182044E
DDKRKLSYWQLRAVQSEQKSHDAATKQATIIARAYMRAQNYLTGEVSQIYKRYFTDGKTTESEAQQILNTKVSPTELVTLRALADNINDKGSKKQVTNYLSQMAAKGRITRLEELKAKSYIAVKQASSVEIEKSTDLYTKVIQDALDQATSQSVIGGFDKDVVLPNVSAASQSKIRTRTILDPKTGKEMVTVKVSPDESITRFKEVSGKYVKAALDAPFMGKNYSKRIWHNTDQPANRLSELFTAQQMSGMRERDMVQALAKEFGASSYNTRRLIRTEANYFHNQTKLNEWKRRGVKTYQLVAVLDMRTSKICRNIDGRIFNVNEAEVNVNFPPLYPFCRTVAIIYLSDSKYMLPRTANDPITGEKLKLKPDATYQDWRQAVILKHGRQPFDNLDNQVGNRRYDSTQYDEYKRILGADNVPETFEDFQTVKYNDNDSSQSMLKVACEVRREQFALTMYTILVRCTVFRINRKPTQFLTVMSTDN